MAKKKLVNVSITPDYFLHFFPKGTVIDRPGLPILKVVSADYTTDGNISIGVEVSNTRHHRSKSTFDGADGIEGIPF